MNIKNHIEVLLAHIIVEHTSSTSDIANLLRGASISIMYIENAKRPIYTLTIQVPTGTIRAGIKDPSLPNPSLEGLPIVHQQFKQVIHTMESFIQNTSAPSEPEQGKGWTGANLADSEEH